MDCASLVENYLLRMVDGTPNVTCLLCDSIVPYRESSFYLTEDYPIGLDSQFFFLCGGCQERYVAGRIRESVLEGLTEQALWHDDAVAFAVLREHLQDSAGIQDDA